MPNRILRESILTSRAVNRLTPEAELFYRRLMSIVDDYGRCENDPEVLVARLYPLRLSQALADIGGHPLPSADMCGQLTAECGRVLTTGGAPLISTYTVNGRNYLQINNFGQRTRTKSKFPPPSADIGGHPLPLSASRVTGPCARALSESESESESEAYSNPTREDTPSTEFLKWVIHTYPIAISDIEIQLIISLVDTPEKQAQLRLMLPLWVKSRRWSTFPMSAKTFFGDGYWDKKPKEPEEDSGF